MFDPDRDVDPGHRRFYVRLVTVAVIAAAGCVALWPSVTGFAAGPDHLTGCLAVADGWHADRSAPTAADQAALEAALPPEPTAAIRNDPAAIARWHSEFVAAQATPAYHRVIDYADWKDGAGACIHESRHRLAVSGLGLGAIALTVTGVAVVRRLRRNLRRTPAVAGGI